MGRVDHPKTGRPPSVEVFEPEAGEQEDVDEEGRVLFPGTLSVVTWDAAKALLKKTSSIAHKPPDSRKQICRPSVKQP
ncbi:MAG: hypothetical protein ACI9MR_004120 [Myxococcota bacterium]